MDAEVEALYGLPLDEFTRARDALAKERSRGGDKAAATEVKALRKPSLTAWALNHLSRRHPAEIDALLEAGERVRQAQTAALEGDPSGLREASREQAALLQGLADRALALLAEAGRAASPAQQERLAATLRAAAVDPAHGNDLRRGTLTTELSPAGFGFDELAGALVPTSPAPGTRAKPAKATTAEEERARRATERDARRREQEAERAEARAARLAEEAARAEERARAAQAAAEEAAGRARALREEAAALAPDASKGREG